MKTKFILTLALTACLLPALAEDLTTLDGQTYADVRDVTLKQNGLFFVTGSGAALKGVTVPYTNLADGVKTKYHYDPFEMGLMTARQTPIVYLSKKVAFSLDQLEAAKARAKAEKKMIGFIMEWDSMLVPAKPMDGAGSDSGLAHFYVAFKDSLVLVFVRHEDELGKVPTPCSRASAARKKAALRPTWPSSPPIARSSSAKSPSVAARIPPGRCAKKSSARRSPSSKNSSPRRAGQNRCLSDHRF